MDNNLENEKIEIDLLIQAIYRKYGYDFRNYAMASLRRRVKQRLSRSNLNTISEMQHKLLYDQSFFETLLLDLTINVTEMFRDPYFFKAIRTSVIPKLKQNPFIKIWHAGCSSGEEVYSMAILLKEEGIAQTARIYATDTNEAVIQEAEKGIVHIGKMQQFSRNYMDAGGISSFSDYYTARYESALLNKVLKKNVVFSCHNLVTDGVFGEMDMILCRNVLIYFNDELQDRVLGLFRDSLSPGGFLCLGSKESLMFTKYSDDFEIIAEREKIYRKKGKRD